MKLPTLEEIEDAACRIGRDVPPTPQYRWPLLCERVGVEIWLKHENHTPLGAFKVRGGLVYFDALARRESRPSGVVCATRGNHGQSVAYAAAMHNIPVTIVVPHGNSVEKNAAMVALGARLVEHGSDFQAALEYAEGLANTEGLELIPSFDPLLVRGVATYSLELFRAVPDLDVFYVPIGLGSGICGAIAAREALNRSTEIVGVVSSHAAAYRESLVHGEVRECPVTTRIADGMACRKPNADALAIISARVSRIETVDDDDVEQAMRDLFECTHNVAEGAGAAAVAAITKDASRLHGKKVAAVLCGANVDRDVFAGVLAANFNE